MTPARHLPCSPRDSADTAMPPMPCDGVEDQGTLSAAPSRHAIYIGRLPCSQPGPSFRVERVCNLSSHQCLSGWSFSTTLLQPSPIELNAVHCEVAAGLSDRLHSSNMDLAVRNAQEFIPLANRKETIWGVAISFQVRASSRITHRLRSPADREHRFSPR